MCRFLLLSASLAFAQDFNSEIRPLLQKNCLGCHSEAKKTSGLSLESIAAIRKGGNRGPATQTIAAALHQTGDLKMPPGRKLADAEIALIERWAAAQPKIAHWSFVAPKKPAAATIDSLIGARLAKAGLKPSPEAEKVTLLRRVHLDLTGILPSPREIDAFVGGKSYESVVDELLASEHYGERWARHWLDQVRYADSDGGSRDEPRQIWRYREWVIRSLHADQPFDRFVVEQLAGDLLPAATDDQRIATGMQRNSLLQIEAGTDRELYRTEAVSDRVDMFGTVFLGLSTGCARCHDHKFDPISQKEYYQLFSFFNNVNEYSNDLPPFSDTNDLEITHQPLVALGKPETVAKYKAVRSMLLALQKERSAYLNGRATVLTGDPGVTARNEAVASLKKMLPSPAPGLSMVMEEMATPREAHVLLGGDYQRKGPWVQAEILSSLHGKPDGKPKNRLDLANWLVDKNNPLLARVTVNRMWMRYFGRGIVATDNDFGRMGDRPSHPELLDYLAAEFMDRGWSQKALHKLIVTSATYKQSSSARADINKIDSQNILLARQNRLRLDAENIRDAALTASGLLNGTVGGPSVFPPQPDGAMDASQVKKSWKASTGGDRYRRGIYTHFWRITPHPALMVFDGPNGMMACTRRARSNTPLQALTLLNDLAFHEMAQAMAKRVAAEGGDDKIAYAFGLVHTRPPSSKEHARLKQLYQTELDDFQSKPADAKQLAGAEDAPLAALTSLARVLLNTDEFITRE